MVHSSIRPLGQRASFHLKYKQTKELVHYHWYNVSKAVILCEAFCSRFIVFWLFSANLVLKESFFFFFCRLSPADELFTTKSKLAFFFLSLFGNVRLLQKADSTLAEQLDLCSFTSKRLVFVCTLFVVLFGLYLTLSQQKLWPFFFLQMQRSMLDLQFACDDTLVNVYSKDDEKHPLELLCFVCVCLQT